MRRYAIEQKLKSTAAFLIILILLPYIVSVFVNGAHGRTGREETVVLHVKTAEPDGNIRTAELGWTEYLSGVLAAEMQNNSREEALKAQAVLIRTNIYRELSSGAKTLEFSYLTQKEMQEKWGAPDFQKQYDRCVRAVEDTDNIVLWYEETYPWLPYHQSSSGMTRSAQEVLGSKEYPYIAVKECPLDKEAEDEIQVYSFSYEEIQEKCRDFLVAEAGEEKAEKGYDFEDFEICSRDSAGYVRELRIGSTVCTGDQFRDALSLPSSNFSFSDEKGNIQITTSGKGHGLGMSLWTANEMAKEGKTYEEILNFFFEGTELKSDVQESDLI